MAQEPFETPSPIYRILKLLYFNIQVAAMMLIRMNMRVALGALCAAVVVFTLFWGHCGELSRRPSK